MMSDNDPVERVIAILKRRKIDKKYERYLITPDYVQDIIVNTNEGKIKKAIDSIEKAKNVVDMLEGDIDPKDKKYFFEIIDQLQAAVALANIQALPE